METFKDMTALVNILGAFMDLQHVHRWGSLSTGGGCQEVMSSGGDGFARCPEDHLNEMRGGRASIPVGVPRGQPCHGV